MVAGGVDGCVQPGVRCAVQEPRARFEVRGRERDSFDAVGQGAAYGGERVEVAPQPLRVDPDLHRRIVAR